MAEKTGKKQRNLWGFSEESLLSQAVQVHDGAVKRLARVHVDTQKKAAAALRVMESDTGVEMRLSPLSTTEVENDPQLKSAVATKIRDAVGASLAALEKLEADRIEYHFNLDADALEAALLGLEIGLYRFKKIFRAEKAKFSLALFNKGKAVSEKQIAAAGLRGQAVNLARHLVNLPPNLLNPTTYAEACESWFAGRTGTRVEVWDEKRLSKEGCGLHLGVGQASDTPPRLVHIRYRGAAQKNAPVALVGKGITFDSGGLDLKPAAGMRLMKKDMGGSAAVLAFAHWVTKARVKANFDFYLALAENSVSGNSFRPGDILTARNGQTVEIHNTDAEGRLVLADAMDVAVTQKEKPARLIDVATLTGAIKVGLGASLAGLFSNDVKLSRALATAGQRAGDMMWAMPLFQKYRSQLNSPFADQVNATDGFGGAITAALFLEKFAREVPWAHLDIYAWKDSAEGAWNESGGSGQAVLALIELAATR